MSVVSTGGLSHGSRNRRRADDACIQVVEVVRTRLTAMLE
jgi:hypothetical protein